MIAFALSIASLAPLDILEGCVAKKSSEFERAHEAADVTVQAALAACIVEQANFRGEIQRQTKMSSPRLSSDDAKQIEQEVFDSGVRGARDRALVSLITERAKNAQNH